MMLTQLCIIINDLTRKLFRYEPYLAQLDLINYFPTGCLNSADIGLELSYSFSNQDIKNMTF